MKILLHSCCAPCSVQCVLALEEEGKEVMGATGESFTVDLFWYNPNIHPYTEYRSRRDSLFRFAHDRKLNLLSEDEYGLRSFTRAVSSIDERPSRCAYCYSLRLEKTALTAKEKAYDAFSSTLLISPYQNHELIRETGEKLAGRYGIKFLYRDFRPRFREGQAQARQAAYYMQKYCGCIYSEEERYK